MTNQFLIRHPYPHERNDIKKIWDIVFQSEDVDIFLDSYFEPKNCLAAVWDDHIIAMGFLLPVGNLVVSDNLYPCGMIYALATLPDFRKHGLGSKIVKELVNLGEKNNCPITILCPTDDDVFEYYIKKTNFKELFYTDTTIYNMPQENNPSFSDVIISTITASKYLSIRKRLLKGTAHIDCNLEEIAYQQKLSNLYEGALIEARLENDSTIGAFERISDSEIIFKEILYPPHYSDSEKKIISSEILKKYKADNYTVRTPAINPNKHIVSDCNKQYNMISPSKKDNIARFGMIFAPDEIMEEALSLNLLPWFGFAFD